MNPRLRKWAKFTLRWGIAVFGVTWVLLKTSFHDHVLIVDKNNEKQQIRIDDGQPLDAGEFWVFYGGKRQYPILRNDVWTPPGDRSSVPIWGADGKKHNATVLAIHPGPDQQRGQPPAQLLVRDPQTGKPRIIKPSEVVDGYAVRVVYPLIEVGLIRLVREARPLFLLLAVALLPVCFLITSIRWHSLLEAQDIHISFGLAFVLNMVGSFYNSFMPGSTGGDLVKAYYAAKHTTHRTRAVMTVIIDRLLGLLALIIVGGVMAAVQYNIPTCRHVAIISGGLILATMVGLFVFYHPDLRKRTGLDWLLKRLPMQRQVHKAVEAMELYGKRPWVAIWAVIMTFPVHITTIISATFAGKAFLLLLGALYYWAIVPVLALVGAIPISPQGVGVMEPLAVELTRRQGVTVSQAFALVMAIRFSQIFWNLLASIFVLRGGYHAVTETEAEELEHDDEETPREPAIPELAK
jgi:uncharacterized protein (TIRG00374 family)